MYDFGAWKMNILSVWTVILFMVSLNFLLREVTSFTLDSSAEDPLLGDLFEKPDDEKLLDVTVKQLAHLFGFGSSPRFTKTHRMGRFVKFLLYTRNNIDGPPFRLHRGCKKRLKASGFNPKHPTKILIHGFGGGAEADINTLGYRAYLEKGDYNVICVDWGSLCKVPQYKEAVFNVPEVGEYVGKMVDFLTRKGNANLMDIHIVGHSLGAHVAGYAGSYLGSFRLGRITGLDPAGILYDEFPENKRLNQFNALDVDVIHTHAKELGIELPIGSIDFYPNGGTNQPGCPDFFSFDDILQICNHLKAVEYFINSIKNPYLYHAVKCYSIEDAFSHNCFGNENGTMGETLGDTSPGIYYVKIE